MNKNTVWRHISHFFQNNWFSCDAVPTPVLKILIIIKSIWFVWLSQNETYLLRSKHRFYHVLLLKLIVAMHRILIKDSKCCPRMQHLDRACHMPHVTSPVIHESWTMIKKFLNPKLWLKMLCQDTCILKSGVKIKISFSEDEKLFEPDIRQKASSS